MRALAVLLAAALMAGCTWPRPRPPVEDASRAWQTHQAQVGRIQDWSLTGRVALSTEDDAWNAVLRWKQSSQQYEIRLIAPFGQGSVVLTGGQGRAALRSTREPEPVYAANAELLLSRQLGWHVPVKGLRYWVLGLPDPSYESKVELDDYGRLETLHQGPWKVRFLRYRTVNGYQLPDKIFVESPSFRVRMVVRQWQLTS